MNSSTRTYRPHARRANGSHRANVEWSVSGALALASAFAYVSGYAWEVAAINYWGFGFTDGVLPLTTVMGSAFLAGLVLGFFSLALVFLLYVTHFISGLFRRCVPPKELSTGKKLIAQHMHAREELAEAGRRASQQVTSHRGLSLLFAVLLLAGGYVVALRLGIWNESRKEEFGVVDDTLGTFVVLRMHGGTAYALGYDRQARRLLPQIRTFETGSQFRAQRVVLGTLERPFPEAGICL